MNVHFFFYFYIFQNYKKNPKQNTSAQVRLDIYVSHVHIMWLIGAPSLLNLPTQQPLALQSNIKGHSKYQSQCLTCKLEMRQLSVCV